LSTLEGGIRYMLILAFGLLIFGVKGDFIRSAQKWQKLEIHPLQTSSYFVIMENGTKEQKISGVCSD
jgi:hypothetical protein